jgi:DHA1 family tetracycline resistance protein-like MFS transporter
MSENNPPSSTSSGRTPGMGFIFITMFLDVIGFGLVIPVMPHLLTTLLGSNLSGAAYYYGAIMALYTATQFICAPFLGALSDRYGRKPILLISLLSSTVGYLMTALAPSFSWLLVARLFGGFGGASLSVASTYIADVSPPEKRAQNFGMVGMAFGLGFIAGPAIGGLLGGMGVRVPFYAAAAVAFVNFAYGALLVPESHKQENRGEFRWQTINPLSTFALLRKYPLVASLAGGLVWFSLSNSFLQSNWVLYTAYRFHWSVTMNGWSLTAVGLSVAIVQGGLIRLILPKLGERRAIVFGMVVNTAAMLAYGLATAGWMMFVILICAAIGGIAGPAVQAQVSKQVPPQEQGSMQGSLASLQSLTGIAGPLLSNGLFGFFTSPVAPMQIPGIAFLVGAVCSLIALVLIIRVFAKHADAVSPAAPAVVV